MINNVYVRKEKLWPAKGLHWTIPSQYHLRKTGEFIGINEICICEIPESIWWNRLPPDSDVEYCTVADDGLYAYNLPYFGFTNNPDDMKYLSYKTEYNVLLPKGSIAIGSIIKYDDAWTDELKASFKALTDTVYVDSLLELGADPDSLSNVKNDILYNGKKICARERIFLNDGFSENTIITCEYLPVKEEFDRLKGKYAQRRGITGITEEVPLITRELLIDKIYQKFVAFFNEA